MSNTAFNAKAATDYRLFNAFMKGFQVELDNNIYHRRIASIPSMCGGRMIVIKPYEFNVSRELDDILAGGDCSTDIMPCMDSGLLYVMALLPNRNYEWGQILQNSIDSWCRHLKGDRPGYDAVAKHSCKLDMVSDVPGHTWYASLIAVSNMEAHDEDAEYDPSSNECEECGDTVWACDDYYCEECNWYSQPRRNGTPEEDHDMGLVQDSNSNLQKHFNEDELMECARSWFKEEEGKHYTFYHQHQPVMERVACLCHTRVNVASGNTRNFTLLEVLRNFAQELMYGPVIVSSVLADAPYMTPYFMAWLLRHEDDLRQRGIGILHNNKCATNPNERNHFIHGLLLYPRSANHISQFIVNS